MCRKFRHLVGRMMQLGIDHKTLGDELLMSASSVSHRMTGKTPWTLDEMYQVMHLINAPPEELHLYFPEV